MSRVIECKMRVISNFLVLLCISRKIHGDVAEETEDKLSKFRDDINQISIDFENFVYDILKEALSGTDRLVNPLSQNNNNFLKMLNMNNPLLAKKNFKDLLHKYAVKASPTTTNPVEDYFDSYLEKTSNLLTKRPKSKRTKRSPDTSVCDQKTQREQLLERQHVEDLKEEVKKLNNLVMVLKDQHKIMSLLKPKVDADEDNNVIKPTHEELGQIKLDLQQMVVELNETKEALVAAKEEEATLRDEMNRQKMEIKLVKLMVQRLYNRTTPRDLEGETVGAPMPKFLNPSIFRRGNQSRESTNDRRPPQARASELESLLKDLDKPSPDITELVKKKSREDNLRKLLNAITNNHHDDSSSALLKKLVEASKAQSKSDDDVDRELEKLENAINSLRPIDSNLELEDDLTKLVRGLGKGLEADQGGSRGLSQRQINELRRRLEQMSRAGAGAGMNGNGGWGYGTQGFGMDKRGGYAPYQFPSYPNNFNNFPMQPSSFPNEPFKSPNAYPYAQGPNFPSASPNVFQDPSFGPIRPYQLDPRGRPYPYKPFGESGLDFKARPYGDQNVATGGPYGPQTYGSVNGPVGSLDYKGRPNDASFGNPSSYPTESIKPSPIQKPSYPQQQQGSGGNYQEPQFFPGAPQGNVYASDGSDGSNPSQSGAYQAQNSYGTDYKTKNVDELKTQVDALQGVINGLNYSGYKKPEDQQAIAGLEQQINELKGIINSLNQDGYDQAPSYNQSSQQSYRRRKRSSDSELYDQVASNLKNFLFEPDKHAVEQVQARIDGLKSELGKRFNNPGARSAWYPDDTYKSNGFDLVKTKKQDVFNSVVIKILDKVLGTIPAVLDRLFGYGIYSLANFKDGYGVYDSQYELKGLFKSLGAFGYGPLIILKIIDGFTSFVNILRKNAFFKNFLVPALVLLIVSGSVIFLIWWLSPDSNNKQGYNYYGNYDGNDYYDKNYDRNARNRQSNNIYVPSLNKNPLNHEINNYDIIAKNLDRDVIYGRIYYPIPYKTSNYKQNYAKYSSNYDGNENYNYRNGHNYDINDVYSRNHVSVPNGDVQHGIYRTYLE